MESSLDVRVIGILGAGQMGAGIAQVAAQSGFDVVLADASREVAETAKAKIAAVLARQVEKGKLDGGSVQAALSRIAPVSGVSAFGTCQLVIEAATEKVDLKFELFRQCDKVMAAGAFLTSNTSSISLTSLAGVTTRPDRVMGLHFMNPPPLMKLVELVRAVQTSTFTFETLHRVVLAMGKTAITSQDAPGFLVNRILIPMLCEACFALQEGLGTREDIDTGAKLGLNHPMGPLELADLIGLDTTLFIAEVLHRDLGDSKYRPPVLLRNLVAAGWLGRKSGRGFYEYDERGAKIESPAL